MQVIVCVWWYRVVSLNYRVQSLLSLVTQWRIVRELDALVHEGDSLSFSIAIGQYFPYNSYWYL